MSKILTVVIPSYNVEKYLEKTLESFVDEQILEDIEVLIVDDGSKDRTAEIGMKYEKKYPNTFWVISKENGGHGSTINKGIEVGCGKYFKVVDGDDWVNTADFCVLVKKLASCDADYVVTNYYEVNDVTGKQTERLFPELKNKKAEQGEYWQFEEAAQKVQLPMHALAIKTSILKENKIRLDEHSFYVDVEYILYPLPYVYTVAYYDLYIYMYRLALQTQSVSIQGYQKHIQNHIDVIMHLSEFAMEFRNKLQGKDSPKLAYIEKRIAQMVGDQISIFMSYPVEDKEVKRKFIEFDQELKKKNPYVYNLSSEESGTLKLLRKVDFKGYGLIMKSGKKRNGLEG